MPWTRLLWRSIEELKNTVIEKYKPLKFGRDCFTVKGKRASSHGELLTPENFHRWYRGAREGYGWVSVCYYAIYTDEGANVRAEPVYFDMVVYDLDIPLPKKECVRLRTEEPKRFNQLLARTRGEALRLYRHLEKRYNCTPMLNFTGNRGYQVWLPLEKPLPAVFYKMAFHYYLAGLEFKEELDLNVDDPARLCRLPYTRHEASGRLCIPLDPSTLRPLRLEEAASRLKPAPVSVLEELMGLDEIKMPKRVVLGRGKAKLPDSDPGGFRGVRGLVKRLMETFPGREPAHHERLIVLFELVNAGWSDEQIHQVFKECVDYDPRTTQYMIDHARKHGYKPYRTKQILELVSWLREDRE